MNQKVYEEIKKIVQKYSNGLSKQMDLRKLEMESDNKDHYLIYAVLGVNEEEGQKIDLYQNMGRFLYKYAGSFLEEVAIFCFKYKQYICIITYFL